MIFRATAQGKEQESAHVTAGMKVTYVMSARSCISRSKMKILSLNAPVCILQSLGFATSCVMYKTWFKSLKVFLVWSVDFRSVKECKWLKRNVFQAECFLLMLTECHKRGTKKNRNIILGFER